MLYKFSSQVTKPVHDSRILILDDVIANRDLIVDCLKKDGFHCIGTRDNTVFEPDLIIADVLSIESASIDIRSLLTKQTPVLVIADSAARSKAWSCGAADILSKPVEPQELLARTKVQLTNVCQRRELEYYYKSTQNDVDQSFELQHLLLPTDEMIRLCEQKHNVNINSLFIPARFISGDLCGLIDISDTKLGVWISDFSGKGIRAALNTFRLHTLIQDYQYCADDPDEFIDALNMRLVELIPVGQFATFLIGVIDFQRNVFEYSAAGATHPLVYYPETGAFTFGDATGTPLGIVKNEKYPLRQLPLEPGGTLLLYSDVMWEEHGIPDISFAVDDIAPLFKVLDGQSVTKVLQTRIQLLDDPSFPDDLTILEIHRNI